MSDDGVMKYLISDHLALPGCFASSIVAITDNAGNVLAETRYMPYGEPRADVGSLAGTDKTYTGQRDVPDTGLMDYRARMYSPWLGRFIQPDTIVPGAGNSQAWNRYGYVLNSPLTFIDPTGHDVDCSPWDSACRQIVNAEMTNTGNLGLNPGGANPNSPIKRGGRINSGRSGGSGFLPPSDVPSFGESYMTGWENFGTGIDILLNPNSSFNEKSLARNYVLLWGGAHYVGLVGIVGLGIGAGEIVGGAGSACAANAQCVDKVSSTNLKIGETLNSVPKISYDELVKHAQSIYPKLANIIQEHHLHPKYLGGDPKGLTVAIDAAYHQLITNEFRSLWAYGQGAPSLDRALQIVQQVYEKYPLTH